MNWMGPINDENKLQVDKKQQKLKNLKNLRNYIIP